MDSQKANHRMVRVLNAVTTILYKEIYILQWEFHLSIIDKPTYQECLNRIENDLNEIQAKKDALTIINQESQISTDEESIIRKAV